MYRENMSGAYYLILIVESPYQFHLLNKQQEF